MVKPLLRRLNSGASFADMSEQQVEQPSDQSGEKGRSRGPGRPWQKGQSGNPDGRPSIHRDVDWVDDGLTTLERMQKVFAQKPSEDRGPPERELRILLKKDPKGFLTQMVSLEKAKLAQGAGRSEGGSEAASSPGSESLDRLIEQAETWLSERNPRTPTE